MPKINTVQEAADAVNRIVDKLSAVLFEEVRKETDGDPGIQLIAARAVCALFSMFFCFKISGANEALEKELAEKKT